jgi:hypothetical protein
MGIISTQGFSFKLIANGEQLDTFKDEEILLSDNVTGLFDLGILPADFTRQITLPGTKKNNAFFEHYYDISVDEPFLFATNTKVDAYFDFDGIILSDGYLQLNKVNVIANKFIDSYEVTIFGGLSSFARDINRYFLTDLTSSLSQYNHTSSLQNITASWNGDLFNGDIVYPLAEYGQKIIYTPEENQFGIDTPSGSLSVQDFKPAIRLKPVWDSIFNTYGYTYTGSFFNEPFLNNVYLLCNNKLRYPIYDEIDLETYGLFRIAPISGSGMTNVSLPSSSTDYILPWYSIQSNPGGNVNTNTEYTLAINTKLRGEIKLNFNVKPDTTTSAGYPQFNLKLKTIGGTTVATIPLTIINQYMSDVYTANLPYNKDEKFDVTAEFNCNTVIPPGTYRFYIEYTSTTGGSAQFDVILDPDGQPKSYLSITKINQGGDGLVLNIGDNLPYGTSGIKQIDFITSVQKKFNLVIYPSKTKSREFIVETFNTWYKQGEIKDFNKYINLDEKIEVIPANSLAVNELTFGDTLDQDYISQQFSKEANREYGKTYYIDTNNFFSQGKFEVKTGFASSPLIYVTGTGTSGSALPQPSYSASISDANIGTESITCLGSSYTNTVNTTTVTIVDSSGTPTVNYGAPVTVTIRYDIGLCTGGSSTKEEIIVVPFGATSAYLDYYSTAYVDCGSSPCITETQTIDCVVSISPGIIYSSSPISSC